MSKCEQPGCGREMIYTTVGDGGKLQAEALALREALNELIEVADLRGDSDLPHPSDDPKLWTARMIDAWDGGREVLSNTSATAQRMKDEIERDVRKAVWDKVKDMWGASPMQFRAAILGEDKS